MRILFFIMTLCAGLCVSDAAIRADAVVDWDGVPRGFVAPLTLQNGTRGNASWLNETNMPRFSIEGRTGLSFPQQVSIGTNVYAGGGTNWLRSHTSTNLAWTAILLSLNSNNRTNVLLCGYINLDCQRANFGSADLLTFSPYDGSGFSVINMGIGSGVFGLRAHTDTANNGPIPGMVRGKIYWYVFHRAATEGEARLWLYDPDDWSELGSVTAPLYLNKRTNRLKIPSGYVINTDAGNVFFGPFWMTYEPTADEVSAARTFHGLENTYDWQAGVNIGVIGGIPTNRTVYTNLSALDTTGQVDASVAINDAVNLCPSNQIVALPEGTLRLDGPISIGHTKDGVTLRGAGMGKTILDYRGGGNGAIQFQATEPTRPQGLYTVTNITLSSVAVSDPSGIAIGKLIRIEQQSPDYVFMTEDVQETNYIQSSMHFVTGITGGTVSFFPALAILMTNETRVASYPAYLLEMSGVEDLTINLTNSTTRGVMFWQTYNCWAKGVEIVGSDERQTYMYSAVNCEVRDCFMRDSRSLGASHQGIDLYRDSCWNLIENNSLSDGGSICIGDWKGGCVGNVVGYNFSTRTRFSSGVASTSYKASHGPHCSHNLFEGNVGQMFQSDGYYGSASHNTIFRNWFTGVYPAGMTLARCIDLSRWSYYFNVAGNVLGAAGTSYLLSTEELNYDGVTPLIYRLGYPNMGNTTYDGTNPPSSDPLALDLNVKNRTTFLANYDYFSQTTSDPWPAMPVSLYRSSKPEWFGTNAWPAIGSDLTGLVNTIPAEARYYMTLPPLGPVAEGGAGFFGNGILRGRVSVR